jgi:uncharacterized protein DUF4266
MVRMRFPRQLAFLAIAAACSACGHVAAYERGAIARPDMTTSDLSGRAAQHATEVHEGAARSGAVSEAGCGCN